MNEPTTTTHAKPKSQSIRDRGPAAAATMRKYGAGVALILLIIFSSLRPPEVGHLVVVNLGHGCATW